MPGSEGITPLSPCSAGAAPLQRLTFILTGVIFSRHEVYPLYSEGLYCFHFTEHVTCIAFKVKLQEKHF